jgi:hypothetical protein
MTVDNLTPPRVPSEIIDRHAGWCRAAAGAYSQIKGTSISALVGIAEEEAPRTILSQNGYGCSTISARARPEIPKTHP